MMSRSNQYVVFSLDEQSFALRLSAVERVIRVVAVTPLPNAPEIVLGVVNVQGEIIPVFDTRKRFSLPDRELDLSDQLIIARTHTRRVALVVDAVSGINESAEQEVVAAEKILPGMEHIEGVVKLPDSLTLIHDLDKFLSLDQEKALDDVMS
jgi:purine-binding chemotaxis protein CheW